MLDMKCFECAQKHLAGALSYAKEILGGHAEGNPLDHRIDLLGELVNLEHHLELIDTSLMLDVQSLRRIMQSRQMSVDEADIRAMREIWLGIDAKREIPLEPAGGVENSPRSIARERDGYLVVFDAPCNPGRFLRAYRCLMENVTNSIDVVVLNPSFTVERPLFKVVEMPLPEYVERMEEDGFIYMTENDFIVRKCDFNLLPDIYLQEQVEHPEIYADSKVFPYRWDCGAPHWMEREKFLATVREGENPVDSYFIRNEVKPVYNSFRYVARIEGRVCCASKSHLDTGYVYATVLDDGGFEGLVGWMDRELTIRKI